MRTTHGTVKNGTETFPSLLLYNSNFLPFHPPSLPLPPPSLPPQLQFHVSVLRALHPLPIHTHTHQHFLVSPVLCTHTCICDGYQPSPSLHSCSCVRACMHVHVYELATSFPSFLSLPPSLPPSQSHPGEKKANDGERRREGKEKEMWEIYFTQLSEHRECKCSCVQLFQVGSTVGVCVCTENRTHQERLVPSHSLNQRQGTKVKVRVLKVTTLKFGAVQKSLQTKCPAGRKEKVAI